MKRLVIVLGLVFTLLGIRFFDMGAYRFTEGGNLTVFGKGGAEYCPEIFLPTGADCYRIDIKKESEYHAQRILDDLQAKAAFEEMDGKLIYAYSPLIPRTEWVHGKRVNVMIFVGENEINVGVPILKGSY